MMVPSRMSVSFSLSSGDENWILTVKMNEQVEPRVSGHVKVDEMDHSALVYRWAINTQCAV